MKGIFDIDVHSSKESLHMKIAIVTVAKQLVIQTPWDGVYVDVKLVHNLPIVAMCTTY